MITLTWKVDKTIPTACPDYQPDPYTGEYPMTHCLIFHCETITENKTAEFPTGKEAKDFADKAPLSCYDFKLNGKLLEDKRERRSISTITGTDLTGRSATTTISVVSNIINYN